VVLQLTSLLAVVVIRRLGLCNLGISRDQIVPNTNNVIAVMNSTHLGAGSSHGMPSDQCIFMSGFGC